MAKRKRKQTIVLSGETYVKIQELRGKRIAESGENLTFSDLTEELIKTGLEKADNDQQER